MRLKPFALGSAAACATLLVGSAPPAVAAVTVTVSGSSLTATGTAAGQFTIASLAPGQIYVVGDVAISSSSPSCSPNSYSGRPGVFCTPASPATAFSAITANLAGSTQSITAAVDYPRAPVDITLGDGNDTFIATAGFNSDPVTARGGGGADAISGGSVADTLEGGSGDDVLRGYQGADTLRGDGGNDRFVAESSSDGNDSIDGGSDGPAATEADDPGDTLSYAARSGSITVSLPDDGNAVPSGANGGAGEADQIAHIENVTGGDGPNTLTGNARDNVLLGGLLVDVLSGGGGDDTLEGDEGSDAYDGGSENDLLLAFEDSGSAADSSLDCGSGGDDYVLRDPGDAAPVGCEGDAPGILSTKLTGNLNVGETVGVEVGTYGIARATEITWYDGDPSSSSSRALGTGPTFAIDAALGGRYLWVKVSVTDGVYRRTTEVRTSRPVSRNAAPPPPAPPPPTEPDLLAKATTSLGGGTTLLVVKNLSADVSAFRGPAAARKTITYKRGAKNVPLYAVACKSTCSVRVRTRLTITPKSRRGKTQRINSPGKAVQLTGGQMTTAALKLTGKQAASVKRSRKTTFRVEFVITVGTALSVITKDHLVKVR